MAVPYTFSTATGSLPLSQLDSNFSTAITIGNTAVVLGDTITTINNLTLANVAITSVSTAFPNGYLANSNVIVGTTTLTLGSTVTSINGLSLSNVTISSGNVTISNVTTTNVTATTANVTTANVGTLTVIGNATIGGNATVTGNVSMNVATITTANVTTTNTSSLVVTGNLTFTGTGNRITGDFSNGTESNRVLVQSSTTDGSTNFGLIPNGTGTGAVYRAYNNSSAANSARAVFGFVGGTSELGVRSEITGTGTYLPMTFYTGGSERVRIDTSGNVGIGTSSPQSKLQISGNAGVYSSSATSVGSPLGAQLYLGDSNYAGASYYNAAPGIGSVYDATYASSAALAFYTYAGSPNSRSERMRIDSSGNVGIGTNSNPGTPVSGRLSVLPAANPTTVATSTTLTLGETTNNSAYQLRMAYSYLSTVYTGVIDAVQNSLGAPLAINPTGGNVGIGTSSPAAPLQIYNATSALIQVDGDVSSSIRATRYSTDTNGAVYQARKSRGTFASPTAVASGDTAGTFQFTAYGGTNYRTVGSIQAFVDTYTSDTNISSYLTFGTNSGSTAVTEKMRIDAVGNTYIETGLLWQYAPTPTTKAAAATLTAAELSTDIITLTGTTYTITLPTGTALDTYYTGVPAVNIGYDFHIVNTASGIITIAVGASGMTSVGLLTVAATVSAHFRLRRTAANTYILYRLS